MEKIEKDVIAILNSDSRIPVSKMALMLGEQESVVEKTVKSLEERGIIVKYTTILNMDIVEDDVVEALIEVKVAPKRGAGFDAIAEEIAAHDEVENLYLMSGAYDLAVIVKGKSLKSVSRFVSERISTYEDVISTATHFILKKYKIEGAKMKKGNSDCRVSVQP